ncbi:MAG TPA: PAS domain S-box protein [Gemmataceae bacterium]|nr:PAS domain S-box protein [Gemmataceae bacterium]
MKPCRLSLSLFVLSSLTIVAVVLAAWLCVEHFWLNQVAVPAQQHLSLVIGGITAVLVIAWSAILLAGRMREGASTEAKFRTLLECVPDALIIMDREGRVVLVNRRTEEMFGYDRTEIVGQPADQLVRKQISNGPGDTLTSFSITGTDVRSTQPDAIGYHKDGRQIPLEMSFNPLQTEEGLLIINTVRDCSEQIKRDRRRITRQTIRRTLSEVATLPEAAPYVLETICENLEWDVGVLWTLDRQTRQFHCVNSWHMLQAQNGDGLLQANGTFPMLGSDGANSSGIALTDRVLEGRQAVWISDCAQEFELADRPLVAAADLHGGLGIPITCGGEIIGVLEFFSHQSRELDEPQLETLRSIGSQIGQFLKRKQAEEAVRASEARKAAILEAALDAVITVDHEGKIIELNPAAEGMFGRSRDQLLSQDMVQLIIPASWQAHFREGLTTYLATGDGTALARRLEMSALRADGQEFPVEVTVMGIQAEGPPFFTSYIRDISERKQVEETLRQTEERFRQAQKMEAIGRLAGGVAHDFNNLLTIITGYSELLTSTLPEGDPSLSLIQEIAKAAHRAAMLTRQLLAFSRKQVLSNRVVDLNSILADMNKMLHRLIGEDVTLVPALAADLHPVKVDPGQIEQVVMNLAVNARDAMPQGGTLTLETGNVELDESYTREYPELQPGSYVLLAVSDTGCGMDEAVKARLFEPFFTTKEVGKGTGLGLATVYGIVKQASGHVTVYSEPGRGTTFKIYFPRAEGVVVASPEAKAPPAAAAGTETVLVVEDEDGVRALTSRVLKNGGYKVLEARHGLEALQLCGEQEGPVHLVVTDVVMPKMNGPQLAERMRGKWPNVRFLFLSGYTDRALLHNGLLNGNQNFLQKPFTPHDLASKVREMLST